MVEDTAFAKPWTIALTGDFDWGDDKSGPAVVITEKGGGNVRLKKKAKVKWQNATGRSIRLDFMDWPDDATDTPDPLWPFSTHTGGQNVNSPAGSVTVAVGESFEGQVAGVGRILIKYSVCVLSGDQVDQNVLALDPMIVVER